MSDGRPDDEIPDDPATRAVSEHDQRQAAWEEMRRQAARDEVSDERERDLRQVRKERWSWSIGDPDSVPQSSDRRAWSNKRDTESAEEEFVPPDQLPPRTAPPGYSGGASIRPATAPAATPGGSGMSFGEAAAAAQGALAYARDELGAAVQLVIADANHAQAQYAMAWGGLESGHLDAIQRQLIGIAENAAEMLGALAVVEQVTQEYIALLSSGPQ